MTPYWFGGMAGLLLANGIVNGREVVVVVNTLFAGILVFFGRKSDKVIDGVLSGGFVFLAVDSYVQGSMIFLVIDAIIAVAYTYTGSKK